MRPLKTKKKELCRRYPTLADAEARSKIDKSANLEIDPTIELYFDGRFDGLLRDLQSKVSPIDQIIKHLLRILRAPITAHDFFIRPCNAAALAGCSADCAAVWTFLAGGCSGAHTAGCINLCAAGCPGILLTFISRGSTSARPKCK